MQISDIHGHCGVVIKIPLTQGCVATLHRLVAGRRLPSCSAAPEATSNRGCGMSDSYRLQAHKYQHVLMHGADAPDSAALAAADSSGRFCHPVSAEAHLEEDLFGVLLRADAPHAALARANVQEMAEFVVRVLYGRGASVAGEVRFAGSRDALLCATITPPACGAHGRHWETAVSVQPDSDAEPLKTLADVDIAHARSVFGGPGVTAPGATDASPAAAEAAAAPAVATPVKRARSRTSPRRAKRGATASHSGSAPAPAAAAAAAAPTQTADALALAAAHALGVTTRSASRSVRSTRAAAAAAGGGGTATAGPSSAATIEGPPRAAQRSDSTEAALGTAHTVC